MRPQTLPLIALLAVAAALLPPAAPAATPDTSADCWKHLLHDYADNGRIDGTYGASCYREAIRRMPSELKAYSDAYDVLTRTLASATEHPQRRHGVLVVPPPQEPPAPPPSSTPTGTASGPQPATTTTPAPGPAPFTRVTNRFSSADPVRVPVPLLVLAGLGLLFVAAGAAGALARRRNKG